MPEKGIFGKLKEAVINFIPTPETSSARSARIIEGDITDRDRNRYIQNQMLAASTLRMDMGGPMSSGIVSPLQNEWVNRLLHAKPEEIDRYVLEEAKETLKSEVLRRFRR